MKKAILLILLGTGFFAHAQEPETTPEEESKNELAKHEVKLNMGYLLGGIPEIYYERILNEESAVGISVLIPIDDVAINFLVIPYYRVYFGKKHAAGFFMEGNVAVFSEEVIYDSFFDDEGDLQEEGENKLGMGFGIALGGKWMTKSNWIFELTTGLGRNFVNEDVISILYPRAGISVGKRF
ncbi:MAG TPA: hypothetical protein VFM70_10385 [Salinimicrobium sp.]|nr:hypothetical protein [Salinimicrobium sp.]